MNTPINIEIAEILFKKHGILLSNISDVVMWLYEKHGIWISVEQNIYENKFDYLITQRKANSWYVKSNDELVFNSPTEAYEAAIEYTLNKLI